MTTPAGHLGDALSALLDGELSPEAEADARRHLAGCHDCALELDAVRTARSWVRNLPPVEPPFGFYEGLLRGNRRPFRPATGLRPARPATAFRRARLATAFRPARPTSAGAGTPSHRRIPAVAAFTASAAAAMALLGLASPSESPVSPSVDRLVEAHATGASVGSDPLSGLAPIGVPVSVRR